MNCLNKIASLMLIFSLLLFGVTQATIEKDTTKKKTKNTEQNVMPGDSTDEAGLLPDSETNVKRPYGYDNFIDKNNNGIDDRAEQKTESRKKDNSSDNSNPDSIKSQNKNIDANHLRQSPDDSVVKLKNR